MMNFWPLCGVFVLGLFIGSNLGLMLYAALVMAGRADDAMGRE